MDGVRPLLRGGLNGGGVCCCPALPGAAACALPRIARCVAVSTAVVSCTVLLPCPAAWCRASICPRSSCGGVSSVCLPLRRGGGGGIADGGVRGGGWVAW